LHSAGKGNGASTSLLFSSHGTDGSLYKTDEEQGGLRVLAWADSWVRSQIWVKNRKLFKF
jgi:hypothetical protein